MCPGRRHISLGEQELAKCFMHKESIVYRVLMTQSVGLIRQGTSGLIPLSRTLCLALCTANCILLASKLALAAFSHESHQRGSEGKRSQVMPFLILSSAVSS